MDFFKSQLDRIQKQLSALTPSQKMLTAAMVAIMVMTLVWWGRYAGEPEMEPLLPQSVSAEDLGNIETQLSDKGIKYAMAGDKILVPADRKVEAIAALMYAHALPHSAQDGFEEVLKNINPFMSQSENDNIWNRGKEIACGQIISRFPDVAEASVIIDPKRESRIGGGIDSSATVTMTTRSAPKSVQRLVESAADVVQGAQSSLLRKNIRVVVNGTSCRAQSGDVNGGMDSGQQLEQKQQAEAHVIASIEKVVGVIPGVLISATVTLNTTQLTEHLQTFGTVQQKETDIETKTTETTGSPSGGGDVGVGANTGLSVNQPASGGGATSTTEENRTKMQNFVPTTTLDRMTPPGDFKPSSACVRLPFSYYATIFTQRNPTIKDPTEAQMKPWLDGELEKIKKDVQGSTKLALDDIIVDTYVDPMPIATGPSTASAGMTMSLLTGGHIRDAVVGVLALVSLFMVSMVVKKGAPVPLAIATPAPAGAAQVIEVGGELAGEVGTGNTTLDGMEMDEDTIRSQQMLEQVSNLVKENPDSAATLVKRWLNRA